MDIDCEFEKEKFFPNLSILETHVQNLTCASDCNYFAQINFRPDLSVTKKHLAL